MATSLSLAWTGTEPADAARHVPRSCAAAARRL